MRNAAQEKNESVCGLRKILSTLTVSEKNSEKIKLKFLSQKLILERYCEAVAADPASLHYAVTRRAKAGLSRHSPQDDGGTERTAGQQPADALKKFSAGGRKPSSKPRAKPM